MLDAVCTLGNQQVYLSFLTCDGDFKSVKAPSPTCLLGLHIDMASLNGTRDWYRKIGVACLTPHVNRASDPPAGPDRATKSLDNLWARLGPMQRDRINVRPPEGEHEN